MESFALFAPYTVGSKFEPSLVANTFPFKGKTGMGIV
jgi:hypothetical protein